MNSARIRQALIIFILGLASAPAALADLTGSTVNITLEFPAMNTVIPGYSYFPMVVPGTPIAPNYDCVAVSSVTGTKIVLTSPQGCNPQVLTFNGYHLAFTGAPAITGVSDGGGSVSSNGMVTFDAGNIYVNLSGLVFAPGANMIVDVAMAKTLTIRTAGNGRGTVTSSPAGINCATPATCTGSLSGLVTLTATPELDSVFTGFTGACTGVGACTVNLATANQEVVTAGFDKVQVQVHYAANLNIADSIINISNTGANGANLYGPGFGAAGNICVNVYAFSPDEQLIACCSCLVTPNGLVSLSVANDLVSNPLTPIRPTSAVVKLLATATGADAATRAPLYSGSSCTNSAAAAGNAYPIAPGGLVAWGTAAHLTPGAASPFAITENPFFPSSASADDLRSLTNRCAFIIGNGGSFGICRSCSLGGRGAKTK